MPELLTVDEVAKVLRLENTDQVYKLMKRGLPYVAGITKGRLILDEDLWRWVRLRSKSAEQSDEESREE
jgi:hypothetical protein